MFRKSLLGLLAVAVGVGAGIAVKVLKDQKDESISDEDSEDDEVHFIKIEEQDESEGLDDGLDLPKFDVSEKSEPVKEIAAVYPFLNPDFIEEVLKLNDEYNKTYEEDALVSIVHHVEVESNKEEYINRLLDAGYDVSENAKECEVERKFFYQDGAIVSDILNVANLTAAVSGVYNGFKLN